MKGWSVGAAFLAVFLAAAEDRKFDLSDAPIGRPPPGFTAFVAGTGKPADWRVIEQDVPSAFAPLSPGAARENRMRVFAQVSRDPTDEHFPALVWDAERYGDLTFKARLLVAEGAVEQIAGLIFRAQDERNFYVARINTLEKNLRFYKFLNGERSEPVGNSLPIAAGQWHELSVACTGNKIRIRLDGRDAMPELTDNSFINGKIGFITKSDTVAYFTDASVSFRPLETLASLLVRQVMANQPRLVGVQILGTTTLNPNLHVLAAANPARVGTAADKTESKVWEEDRAYIGREGKTNIVSAPLHDRNGLRAGVITFYLRHFIGQTEENVAARVLPTLHTIEKQVGAARGLDEE